jgi:hypothetical protein
MTTKAEFEQAALDVFYRTERSWGRAAFCLSSTGAVILIFASEYRAPAIVPLLMSICCQVISWRAMRGAERLEKRRLARLCGLRQPVTERWKEQS